MVFITIIPTQRNDGTPVSPEEMEEIIDDLWTRFGGATVEGATQGHWVDKDGHHHYDPGQKVMVETNRERLQDAIETVEQIGRRLDQKAVFLEIRYYDGVQILDID